MEFVVVAVISCVVFAVCFAVLALRGRKTKESARLHMCGQGQDCHCQREQAPKSNFDRADTLRKTEEQKP